MKNHYEVICQLYEYCYCHITGNMAYSFEPKGKDETIILNFIEKLRIQYGLPNVGEQFLYDYIMYAFSIRVGQKTRFGRGAFYINHIFGQKQFEIWLDRPDEYKYHIDELANKYKIRWFSKSNSHFIPNNNPAEEQIRKQCSNTSVGFINCVELTTLYNNTSPFCQDCVFKIECKQLLKLNFPALYKSRV